MIKNIIPLFILLAAAQALAGKTLPLVCIGDRVRVRPFPEPTGKIIAHLSAGERVRYITASGGTHSIRIGFSKKSRPWYRIRTVSGTTGWVYSAYLHRFYYPRPRPLKGVGRVFDRSFFIYPIGWSRDGKFAYISQANFTFAESVPAPVFCVYDLVRQKYLSLGKGVTDLRDFWPYYKIFVHDLCNRHGIVPFRTGIRAVPSKFRGRALRYSVRNHTVIRNGKKKDMMTLFRIHGNLPRKVVSFYRFGHQFTVAARCLTATGRKHGVLILRPRLPGEGFFRVAGIRLR